jgi:tRNA A-37 threonylcarbamoyl transferase component Bud32/tetratricopeptide (TPR) repeat protein
MAHVMSIEQPGTLIVDRYRVEKVLGRGGMAIVYRVHDELTHERRALKRCNPKDPRKLLEHGLLLQREYHTLAQLAHPHIVAVHDVGVDKRGPFYTMELLDGADLQKVDRLPWQTTCAALHDVASALAMLHSRHLLHRDVSMRNVRWTADGHAKLIDFGAMVSMGVSQQVVGTPPFVAPEALQLQALDGRADLFSLGALGYRLLTGRHAFAARQFADLRDAWRSKPPAPSTLVSEVPTDLSVLILSMLMLDRSGRPPTAGAIIERLRGIARLEREDVLSVSQAYLTMPTLVGRESALLETRKHILGLMRGDGGALVFRGVPGAGRSRMLDACALEGKLLGVAVVRADARDTGRGDWSVAQAIGAQLMTQFPQYAQDAARLSRDVLGHVLEDLRTAEPWATVTLAAAPERSMVLRELRDWLLALSKRQRLLIVVDDLERVDEPSLAWLAAVAHKAPRHPILLAGAIVDDPQRPLPAALNALCDRASMIDLNQLGPDETEALMRSLFGDVAHLPSCAARIHGLSQGNPRTAMELAQHLVDTGRAGYESGSWVLPHQLAEDDLPRTLAAAWLARLGELSEDARDLADALALTDGAGLVIADYPRLSRSGDAARVFRALDELVAARVVVSDRDRCDFAQRGFIAVVLESISDDRRRWLHMRIARLLQSQGSEVARCAHHLLAAGLDAEGIELLVPVALNPNSPPSALLATAVERAEALHVPASTLHRLRMGLLVAAPLDMDYENFRHVAPVVLAQLEQDSGLARYRELDLPGAERLEQAITQTQRDYLATPPHARVYTVFEAVRELARLLCTIATMALPIFEVEMLEALPDITPLFPLSPSLPIVSQIVAGAVAWGQGRLHRSYAIYCALLLRVSEPDRGGFDDAQHERVVVGITAMLGLYEAMLGIERAEERAKVIENHRSLRVGAWRTRGLLQLAIGNTTEADRCTRRAEQLQIQEGAREAFVNSTTGMEVLLRSPLGDVVGVKGKLRTLAALANRFPCWRPVEFLGRSRYYELQRDREAALELVLAGLELARPVQHPFFASLAATHISLLADLGRLQEAVIVAKQYLAIDEEHELMHADLTVRSALVLARANECERARQVLEPLVRQTEELGRVGLGAGLVYEARARVALAMHDAEGFTQWSDRCAREFSKSNNAAVLARLSLLIEEARAGGLLPTPWVVAISKSLAPDAQETEIDTLHSRFDECDGPQDRARCALTMLLQHTVSSLGYLYLTRAGRTTVLAASLPDDPSDLGVQSWVQSCASAWFESELTDRASGQRHTESVEAAIASADEESTSTQTESLTLTAAAANSACVPRVFIDSAGRSLQAMTLVGEPYAVDRKLCGWLVLESPGGAPVRIPEALTSAVAVELLQHGDADA